MERNWLHRYLTMVLAITVLGLGLACGGGSSETAASKVSSTSPSNAAENVAFNRIITATFTEAMDPLTITTATFRVTGPGTTPVLGTVTYVGVTATFDPVSLLPADTLFTATITSGARDVAGNALETNFIWTFRTGTIPDTTPPTVTSTTPVHLDTEVPFNISLTAAFTEEMDPLTITTATFRVTGPGTIPVLGTVTYIGLTATFTPVNPLAASTLFTAAITTGAKDQANNPLAANYEWTFTTGTIADTTRPIVSSTAPVNAAGNVARNSNITATFSEAMNPLKITTLTFRVTGPGTIPVLGTVTYVGVTATFSPTNLLPASTLFTATITSGAKDIAGNALASDYMWTFATGAILDTFPPTVSSTVPASLASDVPVNGIVTATFAEAMNPLTITTATYLLTGPGTTSVAGAVTYVGLTATFTPTDLLAASTLFTATITSEATDIAGNSLATNYVWTFMTGAILDVTPPTVDSTAPADAAVNAPINSQISATFSEAMNPLMITTVTFRLTGPGTTPVLGTVTYVGVTATFTPTNLLAVSTLYTATISSGAKDVAGNALESNYVWTFTSGLLLDVVAPTVFSTLPLDTATDVAVNSTVTSTFDEAMAPLTITTATFLLTGPGTTTVLGAVTYVGDVATFAPTSALAPATEYTATITTGAEDLAGNALGTVYVWTFTTAAEPLGPAAVNLGTAGNFVLLCKSGISTTGTTSVVGDLGISPVAQAFYTGFGEALDSSNEYATAPTIVTGKMYAADMATPTPDNLTTAIGDMEAAFTDAAGRTLPDYTELGGGDISGLDLAPGLYKWGTGVSISALGVTLTGGPNDVWIFQVGVDLNVANGAMITLAGGALPQNIYWQVAGQVVLGTGSNFKGIILCQTQIVMQTGATFTGRALAQTAITLDAAIVSQP